jgi:hypothetical protein
VSLVGGELWERSKARLDKEEEKKRQQEEQQEQGKK